MPRPFKLSVEQEEQIRERVAAGMETYETIAKDYGVHKTLIGYIAKRGLRRMTKASITLAANIAGKKLVEAVEAATPTDPDDRKFLKDVFVAAADRDGLSPQALAVQINNQVGVQVNVQPILAAGDAEDLKKLLGGDK